MMNLNHVPAKPYGIISMSEMVRSDILVTWHSVPGHHSIEVIDIVLLLSDAKCFIKVYIAFLDALTSPIRTRSVFYLILLTKTSLLT